MRVRWHSVAILALVFSCSRSLELAEVEVVVTTDYLPVDEFTSVDVRLSGPGSNHVDTYEAVLSDMFSEGVVVAELIEIPTGDYDLDVSLIASDGRALASRRIAVLVQGFERVVIPIGRDQTDSGTLDAGADASDDSGAEDVSSLVDADSTCGEPCPVDLPCAEPMGVFDCTSGTPTCMPVAREAGAVCRPVAGACDAEETCDGIRVDCPPDASSDTVVVLLTGGTTWTVPADWSNTNRIEVIAGGGAGGNGSSNGSGGGGGGGYSAIENLAVGPGVVLTYSVGAGGTTSSGEGGDTYLCVEPDNCRSLRDSAVLVGAEGANGGIQGGDGGFGGRADDGVGTVRFSGGQGGDRFNNGGGGGGGAAGPHGDGGLGGREENAGGGGGGADGGSAATGLRGGDNRMANGAGTSSVPATNGGGGGGGPDASDPGGPGSAEILWTSCDGMTAGPGSGGGGGARSGGIGGAAGNYGGGGGGTGANAAAASFGDGGQGLIVITYTRVEP